ncbi:hypothetical protein RclHR1_19050011 [Rhizophagus clarus]|uniref:Endonuclease/exonuclease/phosphatase domain-containing protein n=1 Tax=Rhizophagus clarus TaxID=94130 RepID=A0A2Z6QNS6_9GLOM|nr:hypothetical protein RclHR1_19050011 [Rhizophagus clarus]
MWVIIESGIENFTKLSPVTIKIAENLHSSKVAQPAAIIDFTFTSNAADPPPWSKDTAINNALQADLAVDKKRIKQSNLQSERDVASDLFADTSNHLPKTYSSKGKTKTNRIPAPAALAVTSEVTDQNDQQQNDQMPDKDIINSAMDVDPPSDNNENSDQQSITIEKLLDYVALVALDNITGSKPSKIITIKEALAKYNVKYNINLGITRHQKQAKVTFNDKDSYDKFLKMEIILQLKDKNSDDIKNVTLNISSLKPDKQVTTSDQQKEILTIIAYITYKSQDAFTYFETNWGYHVEKDTVRVLPLSLNQDARTLRKQFPLKLSGLAYNTSGYDLEPVLFKCKAKSCFIPAALIRGRYSKCRYAYIHFSCDEDQQAALQLLINFKKGNMDSPATCNNKNINKPPGKKFVSSADNWKNLKKSYTDAAKSKGTNKSARPSRSTQQKRLDRDTQHSEEMDEDEPCFDQDSAILRFKETILNSLRQLEKKIMNISLTLESTDKQIAAIVTAQKALHIEKGFKLEGTMKKKSLMQSSSAFSPDQAKKCVKSADDSDQEAELIQDTYDLHQSDAQIHTVLTQQNEMKSSFQSISSTMTKMFEMLTGTSASSSLREDDEVANVYLNANQKERLQIEALHKYIDDTISDAQSRDMEVIIMGDFNINYRIYLMAFVNNKWQFSLFHTLECRRLLDTIPIFNDNDEEMYTYTPADPNKQESRLDYIWASLPMLEKSVNNDRCFLEYNQSKEENIKRTVFQYDEMDKDDEYIWENFSTQLDLEIENTLMKDFSIVKPRHISTLWDMFRQTLMRVAKSV